jgi:hypothetical protein
MVFEGYVMLVYQRVTYGASLLTVSWSITPRLTACHFPFGVDVLAFWLVLNIHKILATWLTPLTPHNLHHLHLIPDFHLQEKKLRYLHIDMQFIKVYGSSRRFLGPRSKLHCSGTCSTPIKKPKHLNRLSVWLDPSRVERNVLNSYHNSTCPMVN